MKLLAASYNIQHGIYFPAFLENGDRSARLDYICEFLNEKKPDILGINEIYGEGSVFGNQPCEIADSLGCHYAFAKAIETKNGAYGNALISRFPITSIRVTEIKTDPESIKPPKLFHEDRALLTAELDVNGSPLTVMVCHFGLNTEEAAAAVNAVKAELEGIKTPVILMGDFNQTPNGAQISALKERLTDTALGEPLTFPSNKPEMKIDYIFVSGDITAEKSWVENAVISDHRPVFAQLSI